jgi:ABC-type transport system substrate-binding protein
MKKEDPYILELMQSELNPGGWRFAARKMDSISRIARQVMNPKNVSAESDDGGGGFLDAFNCTGDVTSMFYDSLCTEGPRMKKRKRPYFNEMFALNFILVSLNES